MKLAEAMLLSFSDTPLMLVRTREPGLKGPRGKHWLQYHLQMRETKAENKSDNRQAAEPDSEEPVSPLTALIGAWSLGKDSQRRGGGK